MRYNFYDKNIVVGYIKELLHNFNLPVCKIYTKDTKLFEGRTYIKDNNFYKCFKLDTGGLYLDRKTPYVYNKKFINVTTNFNITSSEYDTKTHEYLGNYLRFIRDYYNIDLMPLYNCYSNRVLDSLYKEYSLEDSGDSVFINTGKYNYYLIPVKFNKDYTIALDSCKSYNIFCAIYKNGIADGSEKLMLESKKFISGSNFYSPFIYSTKFDCEKDFWNKETCLYMVIELPLNITTSITVLEGNYLNTSARVAAINSPEVVNTKNKEEIYPTSLSLLSLNNGTSYPFADRLVEYLLNNPVMSNEKLEHNIERIQKLLSKYYSNKGLVHDIWTDKIKENIYDFMSSNKSNLKDIFIVNNGFYDYKSKDNLLNDTKDILGYADKDVEYQLQNYGG